MLLIFFISVLSCYSRAESAEPSWRQSRYIIDNRRNSLFSGKPLYPTAVSGRGENSFPRKIAKWNEVSPGDLDGFKNRKNSIETPATASFPPEEGNRIDAGDEKHVYETRIERVSYHREVIYNQPEKNYEEPEKNYEEPEKNYEAEEAAPGPEEPNPNKFGYVVEGTNFRKYRVEERTPDGFIVGEYGVVSHDDGSLRGVRYTADGATNPRLIYETLIKFLSL